MLARSGVLPARNRWLPERGERLRVSVHAARTTHWPFDGDARLDRVAHAASAGATSLRTAGDSGTTAAHHPGGAERDWPLQPLKHRLPLGLARHGLTERSTETL